MNKINQLLWSECIGPWFVAVMRVRSCSKRSSLAGIATYLTVIIIASTVVTISAPVHADSPISTALPSGAQYNADQVSISTSGSDMTIHQSVSKSVINWNTYNVGSEASVTYLQPSSSSITLNRVLGGEMSQIFGKISSNGQVWLINPYGILFGPGSRIDVGGLVASVLDMSDEDFNAGLFTFNRSGAIGSVTNQGEINAIDGGLVALLAPEVLNEGVINTKFGNVVLAAGEKITLNSGADGNLQFAIDPATINTLVENRHLIQSEGGQVILSASALGTLAGAVVNNSGAIKAGSLINNNGTIILEAGGGSVSQTGSLNVSGAEGGNIIISSDIIAQSGTVDANGITQGGNIFYGAEQALVHTGYTTATGDQAGTITTVVRNMIDAGQWDVDGKAKGGSISFKASGGIEQTSASRISANGDIGGSLSLYAGNDAWLSGQWSASGGLGGQVSLTASVLTLAGTQINADGLWGGGLVRIGGGWQGQDTDIANAKTTFVSPSSVITANAKNSGDGGTVVIWSDDKTIFGGSIEANGGGSGGNGGLVEVSSHDQLAFGGSVSTFAAEGTNGSLLLDPRNITIENIANSYSLIELTYSDPGEDDRHGNGSVLELANGNIAVVSNLDDRVALNAGAVRIYNPDGTLLYTLTGSTAEDQVGSGGIVKLSNGNYVIRSNSWDNGLITNAGATTWVNGTTGLTGLVSAANSLIGTSANDQVGGVHALTNGNYVVTATSWDMGGVVDVGAVVWGDGTFGTVGAITSINSLHGSVANDGVGSSGITVLSNGNYVVNSPSWDNGLAVNAGAVTWGNGMGGTTGQISDSNSLVGNTTHSNLEMGIIVRSLGNGNYVVSKPNWNGNGPFSGAVTWGDGWGGTTVGVISATNSLVGNSLNGVGQSVTILPNGNYVVSSPRWDSGSTPNVGAVTWGNGLGGTVGLVSSANSLVGSTSEDNIGSIITVLNNSNYVVLSTLWDNGSIMNAGAVTWGDGWGGSTIGPISATNSLVGSAINDTVGSTGITALSNGNYVVQSGFWDNGTVANAGAATWGNGLGGTVGVITAANSLVGSQADDRVGSYIRLLTNGNYVVTSNFWSNGSTQNVGAVTWADGSGGTVGEVSALNSLIGASANDSLGFYGGINTVYALSNGNYLVGSALWDNGSAMDAGAVTWGNGLGGVAGVISSVNSLVGTSSYDHIGTGITLLNNSNYVIRASEWDNGSATNAGAAIWGDGLGGIVGVVSAANSLVGTTAFDLVGSVIYPLYNGNYVVASSNWDNGSVVNVGAVTWGNGLGGTVGSVSAVNSLVGVKTGDQVGVSGVTVLSNNNYIVRSSTWDNGDLVNAGAITWVNDPVGMTGEVSAYNSITGTNVNDQYGSGGITELTFGSIPDHFLIRSPLWGNNTGRVDIVSMINPLTSLYYNMFPSADAHISNIQLANLLAAGTNITLQANNDININAAINVFAGGSGGNLGLHAGRSIFINADINTDNGNLNLIANDTIANGVVDGYRSSGDAVISMASGASINAGSAAVSINLDDGAGKTNWTAGAMTLNNINASSIFAVTHLASSDILLQGTLTATSLGNSVVLSSAGNFNNSAGAMAINPGAGRFLVWSQSPHLDSRGGLTYDFKQYDATFGVTSVLAGGNGFFYTVAPVVNAGLTGSISKIYDGTTDAILTAENYTANGAIDGDTITLNNPLSGNYDTASPGVGKDVTVNGLVLTASNGAASVYGYSLASTSVTEAIGEISAFANIPPPSGITPLSDHGICITENCLPILNPEAPVMNTGVEPSAVIAKVTPDAIRMAGESRPLLSSGLMCNDVLEDLSPGIISDGRLTNCQKLTKDGWEHCEAACGVRSDSVL